MSNEVVFCTSCRHEMPLTQYYLDPKNEAAKKFYGRVDAVHVSALLYFNKRGIVQELIHNLKYKGHEEIGSVLGSWQAEELKELQLEIPFDAVIPVPLHKRKLRERGYNQVSTFGKIIASELNIPFSEKILIRKVYSKTQSKKNLIGRTENIENIFDTVFTETDHHKHYLLVDDVLTTGATLEACSRALLKIPGAKISIVCMAMAH
ncbi:ComF family protein [Flavobacterium sp. KB82]|uniref:ComF family protein n=2 Tax=Flavobacterium hungaricum TaxID=2082725 RepID=A0ABR9TRM5_9FLAO|nr:phosphoribosyltransferase family protein [Flavobacterium hungaricum]MBE8727434.1 ComF family protein [Flavobacterium hungaricum]